MGAGEYVVELPGDSGAGYSGLAVKDYAHSTAPNRRYPDLIKQRLLKLAVAGCPLHYENDELEALAKGCTEEEDAPKKVKRQVKKSAVAMLLESRIGSNSMPSSLVHLIKVRGSVLCIRPLKEDWRAVFKAWTSATNSACDWSARMWSVAISTLRELHKER